ncbi:hypothetical protein IMG5_026080 [Ichthyophthirius multifiliis]|uniref:Generative cell specific-1/HAP2 domain-containing protein n=1 Tax=Ichthyophthirius multifiliis TaxID=5932 RepID=G0QL62_ICHMU|nr:hypothetical protein IMG5_026080 [Ichthyophthirius multifiliis]EGR34043.1 hypothetical protein IMG5_026080 [Ichthyophthirius multifiliis]|eukprot:XP_004039347.1 hypothetical protein IMG5_026080 [Ichthyophthirius multifiliis]
MPEGNMLLKNYIEIEVTKSPVVAVYPLKYMRDYESMPQEKVISKSVFTCQDGFNEDSPTCGFQRDEKGEKIFDSQGFCCKCGAADFFGLGKEVMRGVDCLPFNLNSGSASAHCLRFPGRWYSGYEILQYYIYYEIKVEVYELEGNNNKKRKLKYKLTTSTTDRIKKSPDNKFLVKIIGDFFPTQPPPVYNNVYLVRPTPNRPQANNELRVRVLEGISNWMLIEKNQFTLDGTECNKIGVSYAAFRRENGSCSKQIGSCLKNQIEHFYLRDIERIKKGQPTQNLLLPKGDFQESWDKQNNTQMILFIEGSMSTLITIEMDSAEIQFLTMLGQGKFILVKINNFESHSGSGKFEAHILNKSSFAAEFNLGFSCDQNVLPISGQKLFLNQDQLFIFKSSVNVVSDLGKTNNLCNVTLSDAVNNVLDFAQITFNTTDVVRISPQGNGTYYNENNSTLKKPLIEVTCNQKCPDFWDIFCHFSTKCLNNGFKTLGTGLGILVIFLELFDVVALFVVLHNLQRKKKNNNKKK